MQTKKQPHKKKNPEDTKKQTKPNEQKKQEQKSLVF